MSDTADAPRTNKKKGKLGRLLLFGIGAIALIGGGVGAGLYAASSGLVGGHSDKAEVADTPRLVPKDEEQRGGAGDAAKGEGEAKGDGLPTPKGKGGERYASTYFALEKEFTANLKESVHFIQVGVAVSTPYDDRVIDALKTHEIAVRSAILMTLGNTDEDAVFTQAGKEQLQRRLAAAINATLKQKDGFGGIANVYFTSFVVQ